MRISDWSSDVCSSDLARLRLASNELIDAARALGLDVTRFVVRTTSQIPGAQAQREPASVPVSDTARNAVRDALAYLREPDDEPAKGDSSSVRRGAADPVVAGLRLDGRGMLTGTRRAGD